MEENPIPPPAYAAYPRNDAQPIYGTSEKLFRLYRGYHGLSYVFLFGFLCYPLAILAGSYLGQPGRETIGYVLGIFPLASFITMYFFSVRSNMDIGFGNNMPPVLSAILGLVTPLACLIKCIVMQMVSTSEMKKYGIVTRPFRGINSAVVKATIAEIKLREQGNPISSAAPFQTQ